MADWVGASGGNPVLRFREGEATPHLGFRWGLGDSRGVTFLFPQSENETPSRGSKGL